ncbi:TetR/AcrR family transcriptional regulator [Actinomadura harenae]|uniref:TetR/AcrR family transcriptional regulator n=1 Tax=Actinomadura harenae TaxID=2483351 RepID=A0A3M2LYI1_9ACTN|nr:TetR/AcrR family transcriptional regulator [Actinomadura harenae]RMI41105.1 TetR/AcrR family transcriptional regulator [Actinomadura harenae]
MGVMMGGRRGDTREQIRRVALELFAEQGYEKTSLREIAERLGVTKAALYYHFKTKEDIIASLFEEVGERMDELVTWAKSQPMTREHRIEVLERYAEMMRGPAGDLMRFMSQNQQEVRDLKPGEDARARFRSLARVLADDRDPVVDQLRARLSIMSLHMSVFLTNDMDISDDQRHEAALEIAMELIDGSRSRAPGRRPAN